MMTLVKKQNQELQILLFFIFVNENGLRKFTILWWNDKVLFNKNVSDQKVGFIIWNQVESALWLN